MIINTSDLIDLIINMVIQYYNLSNSIILDQALGFTSKFWSALYCFFGLRQKLLIVFHP